jgi:hypothetical protein
VCVGCAVSELFVCFHLHGDREGRGGGGYRSVLQCDRRGLRMNWK